MKIIAQFLLLFALFSSFFQPAKAQNCPLKVQFSVIDATCFNNGKVCYCILDGADNPITDLSGTGLSSIRVYYREREEDSARYAGNYYYGGVDTLMLDYGKYFFWDGSALRRWDGWICQSGYSGCIDHPYFIYRTNNFRHLHDRTDGG